MKNLQEITTQDQLEELVMLFQLLNDVQLTQEQDTIKWKWTSNGCYTAKSAYEIQFRGSFANFHAHGLLKASAEPKCRSLAWLIMHNKAPSADNLAKKNCHMSCNAPYATANLKQTHTCLRNATTLKLPGESLQAGLICRIHGEHTTRKDQDNGWNLCKLQDQKKSRKNYSASCSLSGGKCGMNETDASLKTKNSQRSN